MTRDQPSIAFIIPALNEEENLAAAVESCARRAEARGLPYACYVFDDGSTDGTAVVADKLAAANPRVKVTHNPRTMGLGYNYFRGVDLAREDYALMVPGDAEIPEPAIAAILDEAGKADLIVPYILGSEARPLMRRLVSWAFVQFLNVLFGLRIKYYNGPCLLRRELVQSVPLRSDGFAYMAAILVILLKKGRSCRQIPIPLQYRRHGRSKAVSLRNIVSVVRTIGGMLSAVYAKKDFSNAQ